MQPIVQLSLDLTSIDEALHVAEIGVRAGVDWLEAGTPLILAEGLRAVQALRARFPDHPDRGRPQDDGRRLPGSRDDGPGRGQPGRGHGRGPPGDDPRRACAPPATTASRSWATSWPRPTKWPAPGCWKPTAWTTSSSTPASTSATRARPQPAGRPARHHRRRPHPGAGGRRADRRADAAPARAATRRWSSSARRWPSPTRPSPPGSPTSNWRRSCARSSRWCMGSDGRGRGLIPPGQGRGRGARQSDWASEWLSATPAASAPPRKRA